MTFRIVSFFNLLICVVGIFFSDAAIAKKLYRWIDERGNTVFSDQVPPPANQYRRDSLSKSGRILDVTERAKTSAELELEKRLAKLRREEEKIIARQKTYDRALLNTYHSQADLIKAIEAKRAAFDTQNKAIEGNLRRLEANLAHLEKEAANFERNGQTIAKKLLADIQSARAQIRDVDKAIAQQKEKQDKIKKEDEADIGRFLFLTQSAKTGGRTPVPTLKEANELGLFYCENDRQCAKAWEIARTFIEYYSTTPPDIYNDKLIMTRPPATDTDISLSLSKIPLTSNDYQLFLDIHCRDSSAGKELCASQKIKGIRSAFSPFVNETLARPAQ